MVYDSIIIGTGPAGITAAIYSVRKGMKTLILGDYIGGAVTKTSVVDNYTGYQELSGEELADKFEEHLKEFDLEVKFEMAEDIKKDKNVFNVLTSKEKYQAKTVIIASGAHPKMLNIPGENEYKNKGVVYCATCDAPLFKDKDVAVIGGGNTGMETVLQLITIANKIYLIEFSDKLIADKIMTEKVTKSDKVHIHLNTITKEILGSKFVNKIKIEEKGVKKELEVQGVFINIGYSANTDFLGGFVKLNERKEIIIDKLMNTSVKGVFAAGDCTDVPFKQIIIAGGEGAKAAMSAFKYLSKLKH